MTNRDYRVLVLSILVTPIVYALLAVLAYQQRGYFAFGGECFAFLLPLYVFAYVNLRG